MAKESHATANLKRSAAKSAKQMMTYIKKAIEDIDALIAENVRRNPYGWLDAGRENAYNAIDKRFKELRVALDRSIGQLSLNAAKSGNKAAIDQSGGAITQFSAEHLRDYLERITPKNGPSLAAVYTSSMSASAKAALRATAISVFTTGAATGATMREQARQFQQEWELRSKEANPYRFVDKAGRKWENARYVQMLTRTTAQRVETAAFCDSMLRDGFPLARISSDGDKDCEICAAWEGRLIDLTPGHKLKDGTYTLQQAREAGLFHPNCMHRLEYVSILEIPDALWSKVKDKIGQKGAWKDNPSATEPDFFMKGDRIKHGREVEKAAQKRAEEDGYAIVRQQIEEKGVTLDKSLENLDSKLLHLNMSRLNALIEKYPIVKDYIKAHGINIKAVDFEDPDAFASVNKFNAGDRINIKLSRRHYENYERHLIEERVLIGNGWFMPCKKRNHPSNTITHEFGHVLQRLLIHQEIEKNQKKQGDDSTSTTSFVNIMERHKEEIVDRMRRIDANITDANLFDYTSAYSDISSAEFFAEAFANAENGEVKVMGKAMRSFLRRSIK